MVLLDMDMPPCCDECDLQYNLTRCCMRIEPVEYPKAYDERMPDCPLHETNNTIYCLTNKTDKETKEMNVSSNEELAKKKARLYESSDKMVSHPAHYQSGGMEVIDVIKAFTKELKGVQATDTGNIIKYACRWNAKGSPIRDVEKIIWYATHLLRELQEQEKQNGEKNISSGSDNGEDTGTSESVETTVQTNSKE